jgi:cold shock CspA family protein
VLTGVVATFDERRGDGVLVSDDAETFYFHCVDIADGTRSIRAGTRVTARRRVGLCGSDEAGDLVAVASPAP